MCASSFYGRCQHSISYNATKHVAIIYGGYSTSNGHLGDVWVIDLTTRGTWRPSDHGQMPSARRGHVAQVLQNKLWLFGGANHNGMLGDLYSLDLETWLWQKVSWSGHAPSPRRAAASAAVGGRWMIVHGGYDGSRCLDDLYLLDTDQMSWSILTVEERGHSPHHLCPRALHSISVLGHGLLVCGGANNNTVVQSSCFLFNSALQNGIKAAQMLFTAQRDIALLKEATITLRLECDMLVEALQTMKKENQDLHECRKGTGQKQRQAVSNSRTLTCKLKRERQRSAALEQALCEAQEQYTTCQDRCANLHFKLQVFQERTATAEVHLEDRMKQNTQASADAIKSMREIAALQFQVDKYTAAMHTLRTASISSDSRADAAKHMSYETDRRLQEIMECVTESADPQISVLMQQIRCCQQANTKKEATI
eukprot:jgi/Ulvmu1/1706/UM116_0019.1